ncbi:hypothetical protein KCP74_08825 [Salmonella enterica subsp. enterica]|nr:hypothetical protein KCP74_08825 [Salmonella enterica subsp. enterica]
MKLVSLEMLSEARCYPLRPPDSSIMLLPLMSPGVELDNVPSPLLLSDFQLSTPLFARFLI